MNNKKLKRKKALALFIVLIFSFSLVVNTQNNLAIQTNSLSDATISPTESLVVDKTPLPKKQVTQYIDESIVVNVADSPENFTSPGTFDNGLIIGEADGLKMTFSHAVDSVEFALLKLDGAITSDSLTLRSVDDLGGLDSLLFVYGWSDPYTAPTVDDVNETHIDDKFTLLGLDLGIGGDLVLSYDNISLEYLLLFEDSSVPQPTSIDAIEVNGFVSFIADEGKNGIPDIWEYPDMNLTQIIEDIDLFGTTFEIMSLVGTAYPGSTNLDFLMPFVKLGLIDEAEIDETHFYIICQTELKLPYSSIYDYLQFLNTYDLVNMTYIEGNITIENEVYAAFGKYFGQDQRIRTWQFIDYTVNGNYDPINYDQTAGQIGGKYDTLDTTDHTTDTAQEKFDLDVSIVLDIVENVLDAVMGGKDLVEQFMSKIVGFIQGKVMDGVGKKLLEKIAKKAIKTAIKCIFSFTTVKDIVVKGIMILGKLGVPIPSWLQKVIDFVTSIPFIDPPVEIRKMRLTFLDEVTQLPILGYDYLGDIPIYTHPKGIYFGDTYSAQVILSSRDIFPVIGRIQSKNASRVVTGHLYVEDLILEEATHAKSSLEPDESAQGRVYTIPPDGSIVISQCQVSYSGVSSSVVEADVGFKLYFTVTDENGTSLTDIAKTKAAINDLPDPMILLPVTLEPDSRFSVDVDPASLGIDLDYHMVAFLYKTNTIFHDYCNYTLMLQDTIAPVIQNVTALIDEVQNRIYFSAKLSDYSLNTSSVFVTLIKDSTDEALGTSYMMSNNGTHFVFDIPTDDFSKSTLYYKVKASDNSENDASSTLQSIAVPKKANGFTILTSMLSVLIVSTLIISRRKKQFKN